MCMWLCCICLVVCVFGLLCVYLVMLCPIECAMCIWSYCVYVVLLCVLGWFCVYLLMLCVYMVCFFVCFLCCVCLCIWLCVFGHLVCTSLCCVYLVLCVLVHAVCTWLCCLNLQGVSGCCVCVRVCVCVCIYSILGYATFMLITMEGEFLVLPVHYFFPTTVVKLAEDFPSLVFDIFACVALSCSRWSFCGQCSIQVNWGWIHTWCCALKQLGWNLWTYSWKKFACLHSNNDQRRRDLFQGQNLFGLFVCAPASNLWRVVVFLDCCGPRREPGERCRQVSLPIGCSR